MGIQLTDIEMIHGNEALLTEKQMSDIARYLNDCGLSVPISQPSPQLIEEVRAAIRDDVKAHAVFELAMAMNFYRFFWKYDLPAPKNYRGSIINALRALKLPHAVEFYEYLLIPFEEWRSFEALMFALQYIIEGLVFTLDDDERSSKIRLGYQETVDSFLGFLDVAAQVFADRTGEREILGGFGVLVRQEWYENVAQIGRPDPTRGALWCQHIVNILAHDEELTASTTVSLLEQFPVFSRDILSLTKFAFELPEGDATHSNVVAALILKPFFMMIGASLV